MVKPLAACRLYAFVDTAYLRGRSPERVVMDLCDGGADLIQLRAKGARLGEVAGLARSLVALTDRAGVGFVVNDHWLVACEVRAQFCHLGQEDFFGAGYTHVSELGQDLAGPRPWAEGIGAEGSASPRIGLSTHAPDQALRAMAAGAAYIAIGPVYATPTKREAKPVTLDYVRWAAEHCHVPWFAIGGINLSNLDDVLAAGARRVCVVSGILGLPDVGRACRAIKERLESRAI